MTMGERKQPGRFTVQFNMEDPQQRQVAEELYRQGRRKAQFLTSAVMLYTQSPGSAVSAGIDMETLKRVVQEVLRDEVLMERGVKNFEGNLNLLTGILREHHLIHHP